jgi:hypothetical protein
VCARPRPISRCRVSAALYTLRSTDILFSCASETVQSDQPARDLGQLANTWPPHPAAVAAADGDRLSPCWAYDVFMALMHWLRDAREDLWFGCRRLTRDVDAAIAVVLVLACGIGLSVTMFAVADTMLRRPLPVLDQERVVVLWGEAGGSMRTLPLTPQHFEHFRHEARTLQEVAGTVSIDSSAQSVRDGEQTFRVNVSPVTGNFFVVLGSKAVLGRMLVRLCQIRS